MPRGGPSQVEVVQYVPCAVRPDRAHAHALAKATIAQMLPGFWSLGQRVPAAKSALLRAGDLSEVEFVDRGRSSARRGSAGGRSRRALRRDFAIAGTAQDALAQARRYREAGTSELVLTFVGAQPETDMADLAQAAARA